MSKLVKRPWGTYTVLAKSKDFLLKKITVLPEGVLSYQSHSYRSEHWIVAQGQAEVTIDAKVFTLNENENIFIPKGSVHRITNNTNNDLVIIEMWYGQKLDENDIKRYEDIYKRI